MNPAHERLLYLDEVAEMLRKSPSAMRYMIHAGDAPPSAKIGGRRMFRESAVLAWIEDQFKEAS
ncbi:helix-turn-helix transcriptional regulator [Brevibacterium casei]|uniref:helix-turn-helix transcriptional regulator n=1 Tax=Brevibacterium casei TaxID=33889 RepID=UPI00241EDF03|nr:helix-turn-helix domain-containing protein [Brevibacterium casei]